MEVKASSEQDAMSRIRAAAANGRVAGELIMTIPAVHGAGLLTRLLCWFKNRRVDSGAKR
jgi:hypothetical protein